MIRDHAIWPLLVAFFITGSIVSQDTQSKIRINVNIGRDTTYIIGPMNNNQTLDYAAAYDSIVAHGKTSMNNACFYLLQISYDSFRDEQSNITCRRRVGLHDSIKFEATLTTFAKYCKMMTDLSDNDISEINAKIIRYPFDINEYPIVAKWFSECESSITFIRKAANCSDYYCPLLGSYGSNKLIYGFDPLLSGISDIVQFLLAKAMHETSQGRLSQANDYLILARRLSLLCSKGGTASHLLHVSILNQMISNAELSWLRDAERLNIVQMQNNLSEMAPQRTLSNVIDIHERFMLLDSLFGVGENGLKFINELPMSRLLRISKDWQSYDLGACNWNTAFLESNVSINRLHAVVKCEYGYTRWKHISALKLANEAVHDELASKLSKLQSAAKFDNNIKMFSDYVVCCHNSMLFQCINSVQKYEQLTQLMEIARMLELYKRDNRQYPIRLASLSPRYTKGSFVDTFSGSELIYKKRGAGYVLYSVGINGIDDTDGARKGDANCDDIIIEMPVSLSRKR